MSGINMGMATAAIAEGGARPRRRGRLRSNRRPMTTTYRSEEGAMSRHIWTIDNDTDLREAVEAVLPLGLKPREVFWGAVLGRMAVPGLTPDAARSRYDRLKAAAVEGALRGVTDAWTATAAKVEASERDLAESTFDGVAAVLDGLKAQAEAMERLQRAVDALCAAWGVENPVDVT